MTRNSSAKDGKDINYKLVATGFFAGLIGIALIIIAIRFDEGNHNITFLVCLLGFIMGWVIAMFASPYDKKDASRLNKFAKVAGTFITGYLLSKCDKLVEKIVNPDFVFDSVEGGRILLFLCFFWLAWLVVFVYRQYASGEMPGNDPPKVEQRDGKR